jgi:hypothetical protein
MTHRAPDTLPRDRPNVMHQIFYGNGSIYLVCSRRGARDIGWKAASRISYAMNL